jgi:hypothetical protein
LSCEGTFQNVVIDVEDYVKVFEDPQSEVNDLETNVIPRNVVTLENLFDLHDKFKKPTNAKMHSSSMQYKVINMGIEYDLKNVNLGSRCTTIDRQAYKKLFKKYKDVFVGNYDDLKMYYTRIIQHMISMKKETNIFQHKLLEVPPTLDPLVHKELNKLLDA